MKNIKRIKIKKINIVKNEDVYDLTVTDNHNFFANNILVHNCAEIPLSGQDSCRLGSINLSSFVKNPYTEFAEFDWEHLNKVSRISQRMMDDIIDLEEEKIYTIISKINEDKEDPEIKRTELLLWKEILTVLKNGRRTGIGFLGFADTLAALNIKYGTNTATEIGEKINKIIAINCYAESVNLAKERGCFPIWSSVKEAVSPFIIRIFNSFKESEQDDYLKYGRRNIANLACAPTGSLSILCQVSSGIEPVFKIFYRRRRKINPGEENVNITFVDQSGDSWEEYNVLHYPFINWYISQVNTNLSFAQAKIYLQEQSEETLNNLISISPWAEAESHFIDYKEKIYMQGKIQKWIDHSISVTHNLPEKVTLEEVNDIYFLGWESGCKGLTIYREGSRTGVLLTKKDEKITEFTEHDAPKRPKTLQADYYIAKADGKEFAVIIGKWLYTEKPYEIFAFENPPASKNTKGVITKIKKGQYKFINGEFEIDNIELAAERIEERTLTLTASMLLRHGAPVRHVIEVIKKIDDNVTSFSSVVRRYLSRYIPTTEINGESCPVCSDKLIMADGCVKCLNCGYSKC